MLALSIRRKVMSLFSVVNIIWLLAIIGMSISILPSIHYIVKPLRKILERIARYFLERFIQPFIRQMHDWGVIELLVWTACSWLILDSHRFYGDVAGRCWQLLLSAGPFWLRCIQQVCTSLDLAKTVIV